MISIEELIGALQVSKVAIERLRSNEVAGKPAADEPIVLAALALIDELAKDNEWRNDAEADALVEAIPDPATWFFGPIDGPSPDPATWVCKIGEVPRRRLGGGADMEMRKAVERVYRDMFAEEPRFIFSGWGGSLDEHERNVVEHE